MGSDLQRTERLVNEIKIELHRQDMVFRGAVQELQLMCGQIVDTRDQHAQAHCKAYDLLETNFRHDRQEQRDAHVRIERRQEYQILDRDRGAQNSKQLPCVDAASMQTVLKNVSDPLTRLHITPAVYRQGVRTERGSKYSNRSANGR
jgi:hypothetical protein